VKLKHALVCPFVWRVWNAWDADASMYVHSYIHVKHADMETSIEPLSEKKLRQRYACHEARKAYYVKSEAARGGDIPRDVKVDNSLKGRPVWK
jgi:hypothetical protein